MRLSFTLVIFLALVCFGIASATIRLPTEKPIQNSANSLTCDLCEFIVGWVEKELKNGSTEHRIAKEIGFLCNIFPGFLGETCIWIVQTFVSIVINLLEDLMPPSRVCYIVNMCTDLARLIPGINISSLRCASTFRFINAWFNILLECMTYEGFMYESEGQYIPAECFYYAGIILKATENISTEADSAMATSNACATFKDLNARRECMQFINTPSIHKLLIARTPADKICVAVGQCVQTASG